jgi:hypothetical protein
MAKRKRSREATSPVIPKVCGDRLDLILERCNKIEDRAAYPGRSVIHSMRLPRTTPFVDFERHGPDTFANDAAGPVQIGQEPLLEIHVGGRGVGSLERARAAF